MAQLAFVGVFVIRRWLPSSSMVCCKYRRLYGDTLLQLGAKPPRAATLSAEPITREEFEAVTGTEEI